jgi:hypothetical protein
VQIIPEKIMMPGVFPVAAFFDKIEGADPAVLSD